MQRKENGMGGVLAAIIAGAFMPGCDTTIVAIGVPALMEAFGVGASQIQWVSTVYLLALAVGVPVAGWTEHTRGGRFGWMAGLWLFLAGSVLCAVSPTLPLLVCSSAVLGFAAGMIITLMTTLPVEIAHRRGIVAVGGVMSTIMLPMSCGPIFGPVVGGIILNFASWHWIYIVNVPVVVMAIVLGARNLHDAPQGERGSRPFDVVGFILVGLGMSLLLLGLGLVGQNDAPGSNALFAALAGLVCLALFVAWPRTRDPRRALVDISLMRYRSVPTAAASIFMAGAVLYAAQFVLPIYYQDLRGSDAFTAALILIPQGVGALLSRSIAGRLSDRHGGRIVAAVGFAAVALTTVPFLFIDPQAPMSTTAFVLFLRGLAVGALIVPITTTSYASVPDASIPDAAVIVRMFQQVGGSFGTAATAIVLASALAGSREAVLNGFHTAFAVLVAISLVGAAASLTMPRKRSR